VKSWLGNAAPSRSRTYLALLLASAGAALTAGCFEEPGGQTNRIFLRSQPYLSEEPGALAERPLEVQVMGPLLRSVPGRSGFRDPITDQQVRFEAEELEGGGASPGLELLAAPGTAGGNPIFVTTDAGGFARVWVRLPKRIGEWRVRAGMKDQNDDEKKVVFGIGSGVKVFKSGEENAVGRKVQVGVKVFRINAQEEVEPDVGRSVQFRVIDGSTGGEGHLSKERLAERVRTNADGVATVELTLGQHSGYYHVLAEPRNEPGTATPPLPRAVLHGIAIDWTLATLQLLGGGLLFLLGLRLLAGGLLNILGPALALPVTSFQKSRLRAFGGGIAAGAMFQSSTIVASRLISFANGGLLLAGAALGVILGADLGRTLLPQLLAFPIGPSGVILLALGSLALFVPRRYGVYPWGWVGLGAGLLITGYWVLESGVEIIHYSPSLANQLHRDWDYRSAGFSLGQKAWVFGSWMAVAAAAGFLVRSANLLVAAAMALGSSGLISPSTALPIVLGANLGPALSLFATSLWRRLEARRVALLKLLFQGVGAVWFVAFSLPVAGGSPLLLHLVDWVTPGLLFNPIPENVPHHLAMLHTLYNLLNGLLCLALAAPLARLVAWAIPRDPVEDDLKPYHLDPNLIEVPALAILQASREVTYLTELCRKAIAESFDSFRYRDLKLADQTVRREESIAAVHRDISQYLLRVGENGLSRRESSRLEVLQTTTGNLVRIGALGERLRDLTAREIDEELEIPDDVARDLNDIYELVMGQFDNVLQLLERPDGRTEENAVKVAERLAKFGSRVEHAWMEKLRLWPENGGARSGLSRVAEPAAEEAAAGEAPVDRPAAAVSQAEAAPPRTFLGTLIYRDALEALFQVAGHLSHVAERMRVLAPKG
jgi:phosphate:Na+ symporter